MSSPWWEWQLNLPLLSLPVRTRYSAGCYSVCLVCHVFPRLHLLKSHFLTPSSSMHTHPSSTYPSTCLLTHLSTHRLSIYPLIHSYTQVSIHRHTFTHPCIQLTLIHPPTHLFPPSHLPIPPFISPIHPSIPSLPFPPHFLPFILPFLLLMFDSMSSWFTGPHFPGQRSCWRH